VKQKRLSIPRFEDATACPAIETRSFSIGLKRLGIRIRIAGIELENFKRNFNRFVKTFPEKPTVSGISILIY